MLPAPIDWGAEKVHGHQGLAPRSRALQRFSRKDCHWRKQRQVVRMRNPDNYKGDYTMPNKKTLGGLIRLLRQKNGWTLRQMGEKVGIPLSTLAKVEQDKLSLTYDKLQQFSSRLGLTMTEFLAQADTAPAGATPAVVTARRSLATGGNSVQISTPNYDYEYLCADLRDKRMVPIIGRIRARDIAEFGEPLRHTGEEFVFVLEGTIEVHMQFYTPVTLTAGHGIYLDSTMGHAYVAKDCESALVLAVCSSEEPNLTGELIKLARTQRLPSPDVPAPIARANPVARKHPRVLNSRRK
jgi:transcriptional regulator with XRE-family HTH domain